MAGNSPVSKTAAVDFPHGLVFGRGASTKFLLSNIFGFGASGFCVLDSPFPSEEDALSSADVLDALTGRLSVSSFVATGS